jgi:hypothetical protein
MPQNKPCSPYTEKQAVKYTVEVGYTIECPIELYYYIIRHRPQLLTNTSSPLQKQPEFSVKRLATEDTTE